MKNFICNYLYSLIKVPFKLITPNYTTTIGGKTPFFTVRLNKEISKKSLMTDTSLALGDAYTQGTLQVDKDIYRILNLILKNMGNFHSNRFKLHRLLVTSKSCKNQKKEVTSHYDIGNDFYSLWLDETMSYSCGYFKNANDSLYTAQLNKIDHILTKLQLEDNMTLLDIGCGWGYLLIEAAQKYNIKGLGITLSKEQYTAFTEKIKNLHLQDRLEVRLMDYRSLEKSNLKFDRIVSVGMLEHVGRGNYDLFFKNIDSVLKPEGLMLLHYISSLKESSGNAWIKKYIFPGGTIPSLREIVDIMPDYNFHTLDIENLRPHYKLTLLHWLKNFRQNKSDVTYKMGARFARTWELYLASCAAAFNNGIVDLHQILFSKGINNKLPINRVI
jgi:cyclopropane-fatty-acyl-phospholipid synthase